MRIKVNGEWHNVCKGCGAELSEKGPCTKCRFCIVSIQGTITLPFEDGDSKESTEEYLRSADGKDETVRQFNKYLRKSWCRYTMNGDGVDFVIDEIDLKEIEVKSTDTDPRV